MAFCVKCGNQLAEGDKFCTACGQAVENPLLKTEDPVKNIPMTKKEIKQAKKNEKLRKKQEKKWKKATKKHKIPGFFRFLFKLAIFAGVLFVLWWSFGNMITLNMHGDTVVEILNSGSLDLPGRENQYDELPNYIKDEIGYTPEDSLDPITEAILPYIRVEKSKVSGLFGMATIEYKISAPNLGNWILNYDYSGNFNGDKMLKEMIEYMPVAPLRTAKVKVNYYRDSVFSIEWRGNYDNREFVDAVCGGFNSAYNTLYQQIMEEWRALLG